MSTARTIRHTLTAAALLASGLALAGGEKLNCPPGTQQIGGPETVKSESHCVRPDGTEHGPFVAYDAKGNVQARGTMVDGFRAGTVTFYKDGVKTGETDFSRGNYHGRRVEYFANGQVRREEFYVRGNREGTSKTFSEDGKLMSQAEFKGDRQVASR